jgi:hypothetical protein
MASSVNIRTYRPQQLAVRESRRAFPRLRIALSRDERRVLIVAAGLALMAGLAITQLFHGRINDTMERTQQLQARNNTVANENIRLLATRAQLASKNPYPGPGRAKIESVRARQGTGAPDVAMQ